MNHITLNQDSRKKVKREMKAAQVKGEMRYYNRLQAFLLLDLHLSLAEVAEFLKHTLRTLYTWLQLFITKGIKGLKPKSPIKSLFSSTGAKNMQQNIYLNS